MPPDALDADKITVIRDRAARGGYTGNLVANDGSAAMIVADLLEEDPSTHEQLDYLALAAKRSAELLREAKEKVAEIIALGDKRASDIVEEAKAQARAEGERIVVAAKAEIEQEVWGAQVSRETIKQRVKMLRDSLPNIASRRSDDQTSASGGKHGTLAHSSEMRS